MPIQLPVPDLVSLDLLRSVGEFGSIRQAAMVHDVSQPAASMRLRSLEKVLGLTLLDRSRGRARLTPAGIAVVEWSNQILEGVADLMRGTQALRQQGQTSLRLAASMTVSEYLVPLWLSKLGSAGADISVSLQVGNSEHIIEIIRAHKADIGFVEGWRVAPEFSHSVVCSDDLVVIVAPDHPWANRKKIVTARELAATPLIVREIGSGTREILDKALEAQGLKTMPMVELGSNTAIRAMVSSGVAPGVLSRLVTNAEVESGRLVIVKTQGIALDRSIRAIWSKSAAMNKLARSFLKLVADSYQNGEFQKPN
ncbi:MAG: LysR family transcriptional regulator [Actinomycetota bacterium]|nr:MAG: LysR family transcriptional regulator [Actinomycetota bacterium]